MVEGVNEEKEIVMIYMIKEYEYDSWYVNQEKHILMGSSKMNSFPQSHWPIFDIQIFLSSIVYNWKVKQKWNFSCNS